MKWVLPFAVLAVCAFSQLARAHAFLDHTAPAVGSTVRMPPTQVKLWFTQELEGAFSTVRVVDRSNKRIDRDDAKLDSSNPRILQVSLPALAPGRYRVVWRVLSVDSHVTEGDFTFDVRP